MLGMSSEIGGYFSLELNQREKNSFHSGGIYLNSGRNALEYILRSLPRISKLWIPYFTCDVVLEPLRKLDKLSYSEHTIDITNFMKDEIVKENFFTTIVWMGNVNNVKRKGVDIALYVFSILKQNTLFSDYKFIIIGKVGEGTSYLRSLIVKYNLTNDVIITDEISETSKIDYLKRSKYYFQLSFYEGFGLAALEALVAKNIVIHSAKGGLSNPVFASGIHFNIEHDKRIESRKLLDTLTYYTSSKQEANVQYMYQYYNNKRRKDDFMKIIIDLIF